MRGARTFCDTSAVFSRAPPADARDPWCRIHIQREKLMRVPLTVRKLLLGFVVVLVIGLAAYLRFHHAKPVLEVDYAGNRQVILWDSSAEIREAIGTLKYGDRLDVLDHFQQQVKVRTTAGLIGWVAQSDLLSVDLWQKMQDLEARASSAPVEARGSTRVISNLHVFPGRESPRLRQIGKGIPVEMFERQAVEVPAAATAPALAAAHSDEGDAPGAPAATRKEDWWLVRAHLADQTTVAGWVLGRFVGLDVPPPLPDYASSAGLRIAAWFELNRVADLSGGVRPQYLVVGTRGPEGQPCDFTQMRVFTWGKQSQRYETAFVASDLCGKLPVKLTRAPGGDASFTFEDWSSGSSQQRLYQMHQTSVRRVKEPGEAPAKRKHTHG
jgi:hypothetical protein